MLTSNGRIEITRADSVARALSCTEHTGYAYSLGRGGRKPKADAPYDSKGRVDCSGFVSWCLGFDRLQNYGEENEYWWSTSEITGDALTFDNPFYMGWFRVVGKTEPALPGDVLVYPDYTLNGVHKQGHTGVIVNVGSGFHRGAKDWYLWLTVAHATPSHRIRYGNVVAKSDAKAWARRGYIVRYTGFKGEAGK